MCADVENDFLASLDSAVLNISFQFVFKRRSTRSVFRSCEGFVNKRELVSCKVENCLSLKNRVLDKVNKAVQLKCCHMIQHRSLKGNKQLQPNFKTQPNAAK